MIRQRASLRSILQSKAPGPNLFIIGYASSIEQYVKEYVKGSMKSLILKPSGAERWYMICQPPSCYGIILMYENFPNGSLKMSKSSSSFTLFLICCINSTRLLMSRGQIVCQMGKLGSSITNIASKLQVVNKLYNKYFVRIRT